MGSSNRKVFINCPFDPAYQPIFRAICFTIHVCGFEPKCALERIDSGESRLDKICELVLQSDLGIHDISRTEPDPETGLPRFNMPFELGLFLGAKRFGQRAQRGKRILVLDREPYRYQKYLSDLAGQDIETHAGRPEDAMRVIRAWLQNAAGEQVVGPVWLGRFWSEFNADLEKLASERGCSPEQLSFEDLSYLMREWIRLRSEASPHIGLTLTRASATDAQQA